MEASLRAMDFGMSQGTAVLGLLERAKVPPLPAFYTLLYDYVAGVEGLFSTRVRNILAEAKPDGSAGEMLYSEFVAPYRSTETIERAIGRITSRLKTLEALIIETVEANGAHSASLEAARAGITQAAVTPVLLKEWVGRLQRANVRMREANGELLKELDAAQVELKTTRDEIAGTKQQARLDPLTGLANRAGIDLELSRVIEAGRESNSDLSCLVVDIDHFKTLNDRYGHQAGDEVLRIVAKALLIAARHSDIVGRTGGDEFLLILPETGIGAATAVAERVRSAVMESDLRSVLGAGVLGGVTASIGVAPFVEEDTIARLVERADRCLYEAKRQGRNRVVSEAA